MSEKDFHSLFINNFAAASDQGGVQLTNRRIGAPVVTTFIMANTTAKNESVKNSVKARVTGVSITQFDGQNYQTLSLRLNTQLKKMVENDAGIYEEITTNFLSLPMSKAIADINDDLVNYFISAKGADVETLRTALGDATIEIDQKLFAAGQVEGDIANEKDHDQWFSFIKKVSPSKVATLVMASQLGISLDALKAIMA